MDISHGQMKASIFYSPKWKGHTGFSNVTDQRQKLCCMYKPVQVADSGACNTSKCALQPFHPCFRFAVQDYMAQGGMKVWPSGRTAWPPTGRQQIARRLSVPITEMEKSVSTGTTMQSPGIAVVSVSAIQTLAVPERMTKTSSAVRRWGRAGVPGLISTSQTLVLVAPLVGVASDVKRAPASSCVGRAGLVITGTGSSR